MSRCVCQDGDGEDSVEARRGGGGGVGPWRSMLVRVWVGGCVCHSAHNCLKQM